MVRMPREELCRRYGEWRAITVLAVLEGAIGKKRLARDGAHETAVNSEVRCRSRRMKPRPNEKKYLLRYYQEARGDVLSRHRRQGGAQFRQDLRG